MGKQKGVYPCTALRDSDRPRSTRSLCCKSNPISGRKLHGDWRYDFFPFDVAGVNGRREGDGGRLIIDFNRDG